MLSEKMINRLTIFVICFMILVVGILGYISNHEILSVSLASNAQPAYVEKIFNQDAVLQIDIQISEDNWNYMMENATSEEYVTADISINGELFQSVGILPKGNSSLSMVASDSTTDRYSFKVDFSEYVEGQTLYGLEKMVLNNMIGDATYMKEYLSFDMFSAMGIATPAYAYANITINGEPWGVYLALEVMEESFVQRYFGTISGSLYKPESVSMGNMEAQGNKKNGEQGQNPFDMKNKEQMTERPSQSTTETRGDISTGEGMPVMNNGMPEGMRPPSSEMPTEGEVSTENRLTNDRHQGQMNPMRGISSSGTNLVYIDDELSSYSGIFENSVLKGTTEAAYHKVIEMIKNLNVGINLEDYLDVEQILKYFAVNTFLVNLDSYAGTMKHNYYLYEENGVFQILPWDLNLSFGAFNLNDASQVINFPIDEPVTDTMENSPLISKLLEVDEYKQMYHQYLEELIEVYIESGRYEETIHTLDGLISDYISEDATAFYSYDDYVASLPHLIQFGYDRTESIKAQLAGEQPSDSYGDIETNLDLLALGSQTGPGNQKEMMAFNPMEEKADIGVSSSGGERVQIGQMPPRGNEMSDQFKQIMASLDSTMIQQIVLKLSGKTQETLTEEDLSWLKELGIEEELIPTVLDLVENFGSFGMRGEEISSSNAGELNYSKLIITLGSALILLVGIGFVTKFKKRKFTS